MHDVMVMYIGQVPREQAHLVVPTVPTLYIIYTPGKIMWPENDKKQKKTVGKKTLPYTVCRFLATIAPALRANIKLFVHVPGNVHCTCNAECAECSGFRRTGRLRIDRLSSHLAFHKH